MLSWGKNSLVRCQTQFSSSTSYGTNERGLRFLDSTTTVKKANQEGKKGFPRFKKHQTHGSVEYKTTGYKLSEDRKSITFTDGFAAGIFKLWGTRDLHFYHLKQIKRVRVVRRATGTTFSFALTKNESRRESRPIEPLGWMLD